MAAASEVSMFSWARVLAHFRRAKQPGPTLPGIGGGQDEMRQEFEAWQRHWDGIQRSIDELVAYLHQESKT